MLRRLILFFLFSFINLRQSCIILLCLHFIPYSSLLSFTKWIWLYCRNFLLLILLVLLLKDLEDMRMRKNNNLKRKTEKIFFASSFIIYFFNSLFEFFRFLFSMNCNKTGKYVLKKKSLIRRPVSLLVNILKANRPCAIYIYLEMLARFTATATVTATTTVTPR